MSAVLRVFLRGLLALLPVVLTVFLIAWAVGKTESVFSALLAPLLPGEFVIPGLGILVFVVLTLLVGLTLSSWLAQKAFSIFEEGLLRIPLVKAVYRPLRDLLNFFSRRQKQGMERVVLVQAPLGGAALLGIVTQEDLGAVAPALAESERIAVFVPLSYALGGVTLLVPRSEVQEVALSVETAMRLAVTGWIRRRDSASNAAQ